VEVVVVVVRAPVQLLFVEGIQSRLLFMVRAPVQVVVRGEGSSPGASPVQMLRVEGNSKLLC
jgi:hypothetical protein